MANLNSFHNYQNKSKIYDTFSGSELKFYIKVPTKYNEYMELTKFELVELGNASAFSYVEHYSSEPVAVIGNSHPAGIAIGSSIIQGSIVFEVLNEGLVNQVKDILRRAGIKQIDVSFDSSSKEQKPRYSLSDIESVNDFPNFDIIMIGVKENNPNKKIQKQIHGMRFSSSSGGIGISQLSVREQYSFLAKKMNDFSPVENATETEAGKEEYIPWGV